MKVRTIPPKGKTEIPYQTITTSDWGARIGVRGDTSDDSVEVTIDEEWFGAKDLREAAALFNNLANVLEGKPQEDAEDF